MRLGILHYPITRIASLAEYAAKLDHLIGEGAAGGIAISVGTAAGQAAEHGHTLPEEGRVL